MPSSAISWHFLREPELISKDLSSEVEPNKQPTWLVRCRIAEESGPCARTLRHGRSGAGRKSEREGMAVDFLLDAERVRRSMDPKVPSVNERRNHFGEQSHCGPDVDCQTKANREGIDAREV